MRRAVGKCGRVRFGSPCLAFAVAFSARCYSLLFRRGRERTAGRMGKSCRSPHGPKAIPTREQQLAYVECLSAITSPSPSAPHRSAPMLVSTHSSPDATRPSFVFHYPTPRRGLVPLSSRNGRGRIMSMGPKCPMSTNPLSLSASPVRLRVLSYILFHFLFFFLAQATFSALSTGLDPQIGEMSTG